MTHRGNDIAECRLLLAVLDCGIWTQYHGGVPCQAIGHTVIRKNSPSSAGVVRRMARPDY